MNTGLNSVAFGAPGIAPYWTSSAKEGLGTAYSGSCRLWFTLSHGIINEIYYPTVDQPNTRDFQFLISDGETFCHEEKRDLDHRLDYPELNCLLYRYRLTNSERSSRYEIVKEVLADSDRSVLLIHTKLNVRDESLVGKLKLYALLAPHIARYGAGNSGWCSEIGGNKVLHAQREGFHLVMGCDTGFSRRSVGYVGFSDGWQDLINDFHMDWEFCTAENGNIALTAEIDLRPENEFTIAVALSESYQSAAANLLQSLAIPFDSHRKTYVRQWREMEISPEYDFSTDTSDEGDTYRLSRCVLLAHEDEIFQGAFVASMSIPWGETRGDDDIGGYHLVWTRDLVQSATALLASGATNAAKRALVWLAVTQHPDGSFPQNSWVNGTAYWPGLQLDEIAAPILLAWRVHRLGNSFFDPWVMIMRAATYLIMQGPVTGQERWEENAGYSPSTLATVIAGLVCGAELARERGETSTSDFLLDYADWLVAHLEEWMVTTRGELVDGFPQHYIRINPADPLAPDPHPDPNSKMIWIANGGGLYPARNVVGGDFLHLVRFGIRDPGDPIVRDSIEVIDRVIKRDLPQGPCWRRYNHDGYGQKDDGSAFDGTGVGRSWPILTGERGHYELAAGRDPVPFIRTIEEFANIGGMITEQLWDAPDLPDGRIKRGNPTGAAMPLCWSHAEYITLVRSHHDGVCFDRVESVFQRYVVDRVQNRYEIWSFRHQLRHMPSRKQLRLIIAAKATVVWSADSWATNNKSDTISHSVLKLWFADLPTDELPSGSVVEFTFFWDDAQRWEGRNWRIDIG
jgi:glucoamylase